MMKKRTVFYFAFAFCAVVGISFMALAQWDQSEEQHRLQNEQWNQIEQGMKKPGPQLIPQNKPTKGDKIVMVLSSIPTGYVYREFAVRQYALRGDWDKPKYVPAAGYEDKWGYVDSVQYQKALASGVLDDKVKGTAYRPFYSGMKKICAADISSKKAIHVRVPLGEPEWTTSNDDAPPNNLYRELPFQCLAEGMDK